MYGSISPLKLKGSYNSWDIVATRSKLKYLGLRTQTSTRLSLEYLVKPAVQSVRCDDRLCLGESALIN